MGNFQILAAGPYNISCEKVPFDYTFHPLKQPDYYEADFLLNVTLPWCITFPSGTGAGPRNLTNFMWLWSRESLKLEPLKHTDILPSHGHSNLLNCNKIIDCNTGPRDPPETWLVEGIRVLIWDMCTCWGYPSSGVQNWDPGCNRTVNVAASWKIQNGIVYMASYWRTQAQYCGVPWTHYPLKNMPVSLSPRLYLIEYDDTWTCKTATYPAPYGLAWGCSDGKFYSRLNLIKHAGLTCGVVLPSLCPNRVFSYLDPHEHRSKRSVDTPSHAHDWVQNIRQPDYWTFGKKLAFALWESAGSVASSLEQLGIALKDIE